MMSNKGKTQLILIFAAPPDQVAEADRILGVTVLWRQSIKALGIRLF
jgi:hypothetical protein